MANQNGLEGFDPLHMLGIIDDMDPEDDLAMKPGDFGLTQEKKQSLADKAETNLLEALITYFKK